MEVWKSNFYAQWMWQWQNLQDAVRSLVKFFFGFNLILNAYYCSLRTDRSDLLINKIKKHACFIWSCATGSLHICLSWQFAEVYSLFCSPLSVHCTAHHHFCLYCWHLLWKEFFSLYFRFPFPAISLNRPYLMKRSGLDKRGLTFLFFSASPCLNVNVV